ncbi:hypothetical protein V1264_024395 [Littorina saxatilis]|uniref:Uncharacterized protein n=1 Tax=Littorina saxatilis TaxID=31220 RepID=A0AAN9AKW8_9CAEN
MEFNPSKCNIIRILPSKNKPPIVSTYHLHGQTLETTKESKYLGVTITENLSWTNHIKNVTAKGNRTVGFLRRNFKECTTKVKSATYTTMVRPTLEYASTVWDPRQENDKQALEMVQRRAARYAHNNYFEKTPGVVTNMLNNLGWETLEKRRENNRLMMLYKIKHKMVGIDEKNYLHSSDARTRGDGLRQQQDFHKAICNTFFPRTISNWNHLPTTTTSAPSSSSWRSQRLHNQSSTGDNVVVFPNSCRLPYSLVCKGVGDCHTSFRSSSSKGHRCKMCSAGHQPQASSRSAHVSAVAAPCSRQWATPNPSTPVHSFKRLPTYPVPALSQCWFF